MSEIKPVAEDWVPDVERSAPGRPMVKHRYLYDQSAIDALTRERDEAIAAQRELALHLLTATDESIEQSRLLGISGSTEAKHRAEIEALRKVVRRLADALGEWIEEGEFPQDESLIAEARKMLEST